MPRCESTFYPCHAQRGHCHAVAEFALESDVKDVDDGQSHSNGCGLEDMHSADSAFLTNLQDKSETLGSSLTFENDTFRVELQDGDVRGPSNSCTFQDNSGIEAVTSTLNVLEISKNPCQSTCESSIEDAGDTASSHERKNQRQAVSYSGKSTATILKELLLALNSSTKDFAAAKVCASEEDCSSLELIDVNNARRAESKCIDYFEGSVWNSCDTGNYCDEDLCHNPTQIDRVSSKNEPAVALETNCKFQEQAACLKVSSKSLIQCRTFQPSQGLSNNTQKSWQKAIESEESYVQCVVSSADLSPAKIISARLLCSGPLIKSWLFNEVEASCQSQWKWGLQHEYDEDNHSRSLNDYTGFLYARTAQTNRKLVFDCILEALREDMGITKQESMQTSLPVIDSPSYSLCSKRVHRQFDGWRAMACGLNVDDMVEKEMNSGFGKWHDFSCEIYHMSVEIELSMFSDLIDEIVPNLSTLITSVPMRMNHKLQGPVKAKKDQYFWVGL
ncbi:hypothetical protein L7F22_015077 [Adiantum nelumboides]|nr:hypothetical protein [Adiantum nelumboides]